MAITVLKNNVPWGPFTRSQIQDGLARGDFTLQYLAHGPGLKEWLPLGEVLDHFDRHSSLPPVPAKHDLPAVPSVVPVETLPPVPAKPPALPASSSAIHSIRASEKSPPPPPLEMPKPALRPASFFSRFFAFGIDCAVLFVPVFFLFAMGVLTILLQGWIEHLDPESKHEEWAFLRGKFREALLLMTFGGAWLYGALLECSRWQATVGKQWVGIKVTDGQGNRMSFFRATGRHAAKFISAAPCFLGYLMALFSASGMALHDHLAATRVVKK